MRRLGRQYNPIQTIQLTLTSARLLRLNPRFVPADILFCLSNMLLLFLIGVLQSCPPFIFYPHIMRIVSRIRRDFRVVKFQNTRCDTIEKIAVM